MIWTADYAKRRNLAALRRAKPPLLDWCMRRYRSLGAQYRNALIQSDPA